MVLLGGVALLEWVWLCWSGCGLAKLGVALLEWCGQIGGSVTREAGFEVIYTEATPSLHSPPLLPAYQDVEPSTTPPAPSLPA